MSKLDPNSHSALLALGIRMPASEPHRGITAHGPYMATGLRATPAYKPNGLPGGKAVRQGGQALLWVISRLPHLARPLALAIGCF
jgi:hypothetical protein